MVPERSASQRSISAAVFSEDDSKTACLPSGRSVLVECGAPGADSDLQVDETLQV